MGLVPYEPFKHLENMRRELDNFFASSWQPAQALGEINRNFGVPRVDVYETETEVLAHCDIPGLEKKEDVKIELDNNTLFISGSVKRSNDIKDNRIHREERFMGRFQRAITLPSRVSEEGIKAVYKNGVLEVRMPKVTTAGKRKIDIEFH